MNPKIIIKKYENRRLYDTTNSRYVNLDEVADLLRQGMDVQAIDAATGEDITRLILTQIIVEGAKTSDSGFPLDILRQMVISTGRASEETLLRNARAMLEMYQNAYGAFAPAMTPFDFMQMMMRPAAPAEEPQADSDAKDLRRRIDELEQIVAKVSPKRRKGSPARKKSARKG